ncbi:MAG: radical SAM protein [Methanobacteriota archaeon]
MGVEVTSFHEKVTILFHILERCNLRCSHCFIRAKKTSTNEISFDKIREVLTDVKHMNVDYVAFTGGEVTLRADFLDILHLAKEVGIRTCFVTNGTCIDSDLAAGLRNLTSDVLVSVDGPQEFHDRFRGMHGAFDKTMQGIECLKQYDVPFSLQFTVTKESWRFIDWIVERAVSLGASGLKLEPLIQMGRAAELSNQQLNPQELYQLYLKTMEAYGKFLWSKTNILVGLYSTAVLKEHPCNAYACFGEQCHRKATTEPREIIIMPNGDMVPIHVGMHPSYYLGNIYNGGFDNVFKEYMGGEKNVQFIKLCRYVYDTYVVGYQYPVIAWSDLLALESNRFEKKVG